MIDPIALLILTLLVLLLAADILPLAVMRAPMGADFPPPSSRLIRLWATALPVLLKPALRLVLTIPGWMGFFATSRSLWARLVFGNHNLNALVPK